MRQAAKMPGLAEKSSGESKQSGFLPPGNFPPVSRPCPMGQQPRPKGRPRLVTELYQSKGCQRSPEIPFGRLGFRNERIGSQGNRHLRDSVESVAGNMGDPSVDANESGMRALETTPENLGCVWRESAWP